jgi:hypothetical protein
VIREAYADGFNPIEHRVEKSIDEMVTVVQKVLSIDRYNWKPEYSHSERIEASLREGYWQHVKSCFDYTNARVIELGDHIPYVNIGGGFTYILYASDMSRCLLLVGNLSD